MDPLSRPLRVLFVHENRDGQTSLDLLAATGLTHAAAVGTDQALAALARESADVLLLDLDASSPDAAVTAARLRATAPGLPVVVVVEHEGDALAAARLGARECLLRHELTPAALRQALRYAADVARADAELARRERYYRALIENSADVISIFDLDGTIRYQSPSVRRVLGYRADDLVGLRVFDFLHPEDVELAQQALARAASGDGPRVVTLEVRFRHRDGSWRVLEVAGESRLDDPAVNGIVCNARDRTEHKQAEEALGMSQEQLRQFQRIEAIGRLAGGVAHDFNNLLTAMSGHLFLLASDMSESDPRHFHLDEIKKAAERAAALTRQLLAFSRKQVLNPKIVDLNAVVGEIERMLRRLIGEDIELVTATEAGLGSVRADLSQIEQVIMNLVVNARDAMPDGGRLVIETANAHLGPDHPRKYGYVKPGPYVVLAVADTGHGMDESIRSRVFEPFFTTKEIGKGTGLGLSTVYGIVKQSNGFIWVDSEVGVGTRFEIYLPRVDAAPDPLPRTAHAAPLAAGRETILLVEDEEAVRSLASGILRRSGYTVLDAPAGPDALRLAQAHPGRIDLLLTDVVMPQMSGRDVADALLEQDPSLRVLFMSGYAADVLDGYHAHGFLQKPFTPDLLSRKVREALDTPVVA